MNSVYDLPDGRKSVIYTEGNRIMLHAFPARRGTSLFALKDDYLSDLTSVSFYGIIYFAYINLQGQVVFDGIGEGEEKVFACQSRLDEMEMQWWSVSSEPYCSGRRTLAFVQAVWQQRNGD